MLKLKVHQILHFIVLIGMCSACGADEVGFPPPLDKMYYPLGLATHPEGRYLYVSNAVYDRKYNASTLMVLDTYTQKFLPQATVKLGLFSGEVVIAKRACKDITRCDTDSKVFAFTTSRDDNSLVTLELKADLGDNPQHINCGQDSARQKNSEADRRCTGDYVQSRVQGRDLPKNPFSIAVDQDGLFLTHLNPGSMSRWQFAPLSDYVKGIPTYDCRINFDGILAVASHPLLESAFLSNRNSAQVIISEVYPNLRGRCNLSLQAGPPTRLTKLTSTTRGITFSADGALMYLANSTDRSLNIYDTSINTYGQTRNRLLKSIPVGREVNVLRVAGLRANETRIDRGLLQGAADRMIDEQGQGYIYVSLFDDKKIHVIDPQSFQMIHSIDVGSTPHDIAFVPDINGKLKAYVSNFDQHSISVIDLDPNSSTYFQKINTIR